MGLDPRPPPLRLYCLSKVVFSLNCEKLSRHPILKSQSATELWKVILPLNHYIDHDIRLYVLPFKSDPATEFSKVILPWILKSDPATELSKVILPLNSQESCCHWILKSHLATESLHRPPHTAIVRVGFQSTSCHWILWKVISPPTHYISERFIWVFWTGPTSRWDKTILWIQNFQKKQN